MIRPDADYLRFVAARDPIGAWERWTNEMGGVPIGRKIWDIVSRGDVDPLDALAKGARTGEIGQTGGLRLVEGGAP